MRLTLRTMLAYMDDILEPEDAELIGKKIEESEFATELLHRTRDVMRRLRLGTPDVADRGAGLDPNTVAEYLDNSLADDRVLDFEKVCLESDVHLAEVAACHQILALVLGEPAEVDPASRQRLYQLPQLVDAQVKAATEAAELAAAGPAAKSRPDVIEAGTQSATQSARVKPGVVPEWLRDQQQSRRRWWPKVAAVALVLVCAVFLLAVTGQFKAGSFLGDFLAMRLGDKSIKQAREPADVREGSRRQGSTASSDRAEAGTAEAGAPAAAVEGSGAAMPGSPASAPSTEVPESPGAASELPPPAIPADVVPRVPPAIGPESVAVAGPGCGARAWGGPPDSRRSRAAATGPASGCGHRRHGPWSGESTRR